MRKVAPDETISTFAGNGTAGFAGDNGLATSAELSDPIGLTFDPAGNLYLTDKTEIRVINTSGYISIYAGKPEPYAGSGYTGDGGPALDAELSDPLSMLTDPSGNLYFTDGNEIRFVANIMPPVTPAPAPKLNVPNGTYPHNQQVTISDALLNAEFHYTMDGSTPTIDSPVWEGTAQYIGRYGFQIKVIATAPNYLPSAETDGYYTRQLPPAPAVTLMPSSGKYINSVTVMVSGTGTPSEVHYTTDGSMPTKSSPPCPIGGIVLNASTSRFTVIRAANFTPGYSAGPVSLGSYSLVPQTPTPAIQPVGGTDPAGKQITISDSIAGAEIRYTTDGSTPTIQSTLYRGPIILSAPITVQAIAIASGEAPSEAATASFTVSQ